MTTSGLARLVNGGSERAGFDLSSYAPPGSRLDIETASRLISDPEAGLTRLSADPRAVPAGEIDQIEVLGTHARPFD